MSDSDVWGTARKMIELYGDEAHSIAGERAGAALGRGDQQWFSRWNIIAEALGDRARRQDGPRAQAASDSARLYTGA